MKKKQILTAILKMLFSLLIIVIFFVLLFLFLHYAMHIDFKDLKDREMVQKIIAEKGSYAPIIFILISFLQVTFIPIPGSVTIIAGSYLFGFFQSFIYSYIGMLIGSILAFYLGRIIGRPFVNWVVGDSLTVDKYLNRFKGKETILLFFMFLFPFFPDDLLCSLAGITPLSWGRFIIMQIITRATSILGTLIFMSGEIIPYNAWGITLLVILSIFALIAFIISYKNADKINEFIDKLALKITNKFKKK